MQVWRERFLTELKRAGESVDMDSIAIAAKVSYQNEVVPAMLEDKTLLDEVLKHLSRVRFALLQRACRHAMGEVDEDESISVPAIKFIVAAIDDRSVLGEQFVVRAEKTPQGKKATAGQRKAENLLEHHKSELGLGDGSK